MNNRNCKPSLRLVDGGPSPWSIKGMLRAATAPAAPAETITQKYARQDAERAAKAAAAAPAPVAAPAPGAGLAGYVGNTALQAREKAAGLRDGGEVPGSGRGDKVPALYEPGEFVVSNAMLKRAPGLRDQLHDLRAEALAGQGKTVAQADAEAYDGPRRLRALDGFSVDERPWNGARDARLFANQPGPGNPNVGSGGSAQAQAFRAANTGGNLGNQIGAQQVGEIRGPAQVGAQPAGGGVAGPGGVVQPNEAPGRRGVLQTARNGLRGAAQFVTGAGESAGSVGGAFKSVGKGVASGARAAGSMLNGAAPLILANTAYTGFNTPTEKYRERFGLETADPSFLGDVGVRALGAASDLGNSLTFGLAGDNLFRDKQSEAASAQTNTPSLRSPAAQTYSGPMGPQINPDAPSLRGRPGADVAGAPGVSKFTENGRTLYSNVAGDNAAMLDKRQVGIVPGMSQGLINQTLTNPDGSRWSANDNAIMAANLRDGIDPYRGTSRQKGEDEAAQLKGMRELAFSKPGTPGRRSATKMFAEQQQQQTLRQGQDLKYKGDTYNADMTAATAQLKARADATKDQRDFAVSRYDKGLEQGAKMDEQGRAAFKNKFDTLDKDGKPIARPDMEAAANELVMRQNPNWSQLPQRERAQLQSDAFDHISLVGNLRDHQNNSIWQSIGLKDADVRADHLPDLKGARVEETGFIEGKVTPNASSGDYKITTRDGKTMYLGRDKVTEDQLSYLKRNGAKFGNQ